MPPRPSHREEPDLYASPESGEDLSKDLQETKQRLVALRQQMEEYERRERQLEELRNRQLEVANGQRSMKEKMSRGLIVLERAELEAQRDLDQIALTRQAFREHLETLESIHPEEWVPEQLDENLTQSIAQIDLARSVYNQSRSRLNVLNGQDIESSSTQGEDGEAPTEQDSFFNWLRKGLAFTLPLILTLTLLIIAILSRRG